jgi:hypothetical protein
MKEEFDHSIENKDENDFSEKEKIFSEHFPGGKIEEISINSIPEKAMNYFEAKSKQLISPKDYKPDNFEKFFLVNHADGKQTFLAQQTKNYANPNGGIEKLTYFVDMENEKVLGRAELRLNIKYPEEYADFFKDKPFVGWTSTEEDFQRSGFGKRRLYLMNAISQTFYGLPLYSDTSISPSAKSMWESLVQKGEAKKFKEGTRDRYVFTGRKFNKN